MNNIFEKIQGFTRTLNSLLVAALALTGFGYVLNILAKPIPVVIEQIYIPSNFEERGLKSDILIQRILDQIQVLRSTAKIDKAESAEFGNIATKPDAEIDASIGGLSIKSIEQLIMTVFEKKPKKISGDIINVGNGDDIILQTKLRHGNFVISAQEFSIKNNNIDTLINKMAFDLYRHFEPFRASLAAYRLGQKDEARDALRPLLSSLQLEERKYALWLRSQLAQPQQQELDLLEAISIDPKFTLSLVSLSALERGRKNYAGSHSYADRAIEANNKSPIGYHEKGRTYRAEQKFDEAIGLFKKACSLDLSFAPCHNQLGEIYLMNADQSANSNAVLRNAYVEFVTALKIDPMHQWAYSNAAYAALRLGDIKEAQILIRRAIELDPNNPTNTIRLAGIFYKIGEKEQAKELIEKLLPSLPDWQANPPPGWGNRAIIRDVLS